jgi:hypothetical protein
MNPKLRNTISIFCAVGICFVLWGAISERQERKRLVQSVEESTRQNPHSPRTSYLVSIPQPGIVQIRTNVETGPIIPELGASNSIAIGYGAEVTRSRQLVITWEDGTELRMDLPTNTWIRGWRP